VICRERGITRLCDCVTEAGHSSESLFHTLHAVLWASDADPVEVRVARQTHSFLLAAADWRRMLPR